MMRKVIEIKLKYRINFEIRKSEWFLGLGPCGEVVNEMWAGYDNGHFIIQQLTDKSIKEFVFKESDIVGPVMMKFFWKEDANVHRSDGQLQDGNISAPVHARIGTSRD